MQSVAWSKGVTRLNRGIVAAALLMGMPGASVGAAAPYASSPYADLLEYQAVRLEAEDLQAAMNLPIESLSLAAVVNGSLEPIPFQIDEYNTGGGVYFDNWDVPIDGKRDVFDGHDKLLFVNR